MKGQWLLFTISGGCFGAKEVIQDTAQKGSSWDLGILNSVRNELKGDDVVPWTSTECHCCISRRRVPCSMWICKDHKVFQLQFSICIFPFLFLPSLLTRTSCWSASVSLWKWNRNGSPTPPLPAFTSVPPWLELRCAALFDSSLNSCLFRYEAKSSVHRGKYSAVSRWQD